MQGRSIHLKFTLYGQDGVPQMSSDQNAILRGCLSDIKHQSSLMKQCLDDGNLLQALKHCSNFLSELRTSQLTPKQYYELYIIVFDSLEILSQYLLASYKSKQKKRKDNENSPFLADLYELVQYSGNIIPRLYMMILIGTTYMMTNEAPKEDIMKDMIEMCKGVQHPIRGLFLRYYLSQRIKHLLPKSNATEFNETIDFLVTNFIEMNKLWVRLQHQGHSSERELRYKERKELKILVGSNLVRLSQIIDDYVGDDDYSNIGYYKEKIFPVITEQIVQCRDHLAQTYLIDVLIQIFPNTFHFVTLKELLDVFMSLHPLIKRSELVSTLIDRFLTDYKFELEAETDLHSLSLSDKTKKSEFSYKNLFDDLWNFYLKLYSSDSDLPIEEHSSILRSLIKLSLTFDPDNYDNLGKIYKFGLESMVKRNENDSNSVSSTKLWLELLKAPIEAFSSLKELLSLSFFYEFYLKLDDVNLQKEISLQILGKFLSESDKYRGNFVDTADIDTIFRYLNVLISDSDTQITTSKNLGIVQSFKFTADKTVSSNFLQFQCDLSKALHLLQGKDPSKNISNLLYVRKHYLSKCQANIIHTYPTLISLLLSQVRLVGLASLRKGSTDRSFLLTIFKSISIAIDELYRYHQKERLEYILQLYLSTASVADQLQLESVSYELFTQCFVVYEENLMLGLSRGHIPDPRSSNGGSLPYKLIILIANALNTLRYFTKSNYEELITKLTLYGSKLLKKHEQCRSVYYCAHLWWWCDLLIEGSSPTVQNQELEGNSVLYRNSKRVLECLQKSLRVADSCMDPYLSLELFVEILNRCLIFNVYGNYLVNAHYINGLIELIKTNIANLRDDSSDAQNTENVMLAEICDYFDRTIAYIKELVTNEERFLDVIV